MTKVMTSLPTSLLIFLAIESIVMDPTQFRERFKAWKDGKKPYKDGLPAYGDGKQIKKKWKYTPSDTVRSHIAKWEDSDFAEQNKQFGGDAVGAKAIEFANAIGEDIGRRLTSKELDGIFSTFYNLSPKTFNEKILPSIKKYAMDPNVLNRNELVDTMSNRYTLAAQKYQKGIKRRAAADTALTGLTRVEPQILEYKTKDGNKVIKFDYGQQFQPQPIPKPIPETQYPLSGSQAPESLSSWNAAQSPSATPTIPSIQKLNNERQKAVQGTFQLPEVTVLGNRRTSLLPKMPSLNDALMAYSPQNQMNRALSESLGLNDLWDDSDVTSDLFKFKNGKLPRYGDGLVPGLGKPKKLTPRDIKVSPGEPGLQTVGPMEKALIGWLGGRAITGGLSMYNRARAFKQAKETYRQARQWNEQTRDASRAWKIADADKTARNPFYSGSDEPLGWLYDTLLRPAINAYDKLNQSPIGIILP